MMKPEDGVDSLLLFEEEGKTFPAEGRVLRYLAQTLSVSKTLQRFSSLTPKDLQEILYKSAQRAAEQKAPIEVQPVRKEGLEFLMYVDGASRGNPGEAGVGVVITDSQGRTVKEYKAFLGVATNNVAEYRALILGLEKPGPWGGTWPSNRAISWTTWRWARWATLPTISSPRPAGTAPGFLNPARKTSTCWARFTAKSR